MVQIKKNTSEFLKASDIEGETIVTILGAGEDRKTKYGIKLWIPVSLDGVEKTWTINNTSKETLAMKYGMDTSEWVGKNAKLSTMTQMVNKSQVKVIYGHPTEEGPVTTPDIKAPEVDATQWEED